MRRSLALLLLVAVLPAPASAGRGPGGREEAAAFTPQPAGLSVQYRLPYAGGSELATDGRYVYAGQFNGRTARTQFPRQGGVRIFDSTTTPPRHVGTIRCAGTDMDVAVVRPGVLAVAHHVSACGVRGNGVTVFDVTNPARPVRLSSLPVGSAHTLTAVPGTSLVYVSPGGSGSGGGLSTIVDLTDARRPRVVSRFRWDGSGCHDVTFSTTPAGRTLGVCAGARGIRLWDLTDPVDATELAYVPAYDHRRDYQIQFPHGAAISADGGLLVVNDEAYFGHRCDGNDPADAGALHLYDILVPDSPRYLGRIVPPRGRHDAGRYREFDTWCTSHQLGFVPGSRRLVNAWFSGGVSVWDLTVPVAPREEAFYMPPDALTWAAHWFGDRIWVNDMRRGLEVLTLDPVRPVADPRPPAAAPAAAAGVTPAWRPATRRTTAIAWRPPLRGRNVCPLPA